MHSNDYTTAQSLPRWRVVQQPPLLLQTFFQLLHIMNPRAVDPLLKYASREGLPHLGYVPDALVHRIQIWRIRWPRHLWRDKLWRLSLSAAWWQCHVHDVPVSHLAEKRSNPRKQSGYPTEAYSAELYSGNSHRWHPWFQEVQLRSTKTGHCHRDHQGLRSGVVVWMHVFAWMMNILNINFEPLTFCCVLLVSSILVSLNVIDINMCKVLILVWNVLLLCLRLSHGMVATQWMCGNKFLRQWLCHCLVKWCTKNYENPSIFVKVTAKKSVVPFFLDTVYKRSSYWYKVTSFGTAAQHWQSH